MEATAALQAVKLDGYALADVTRKQRGTTTSLCLLLL